MLALCCVSFILHNISLSGCFHLLKSKVCQNILLYRIKIAPCKTFVRVLYTVMVHNLERESRIINLQNTGLRLVKLIFDCYQSIVQILIGVVGLSIKIKPRAATKCSVLLFLIFSTFYTFTVLDNKIFKLDIIISHNIISHINTS